MALSTEARTLLLGMARAEAGQIDVSAIPNAELDDAAEAIDALFVYRRRLMVNPMIARTLDAEEQQAVTRLVGAMGEAMLTGRASLAQLPNGRVGVDLGLDRGAMPEVDRPGQIRELAAAPGSARVKKYWWGLRVYLNHLLVGSVLAAGGAAASVLASVGVPWWVSVIIAGVLAWVKAADRGNGVYFYVTWAGGWWIQSA